MTLELRDVLRDHPIKAQLIIIDHLHEHGGITREQADDYRARVRRGETIVKPAPVRRKPRAEPKPRAPQHNWSAVNWGERNEVIAEKLGASPSTVAKWRRRLGKPLVPGHKKNSAAHWDHVDWSLTDTEIADSLGVTRSRVGQKRRHLGKPKAAPKADQHLTALAALDTSSMTASQVATHFGWNKGTTYDRLRRLGRSVANGGFKRHSGPRPGARKYDWDSVDWVNKGDTQIARELGCSQPSVVTMTRKRLGKPRNPNAIGPRS